MALALALFAAPCAAPDVETLKRRRDAKIAEAWFTSAGWIRDYGDEESSKRFFEAQQAELDRLRKEKAGE